MAQITVLDSSSVVQTVAKVTNTGATTATNSLPVVLASDDPLVAAHGAQADAAAAGDTSTASLIALLKRNNQNLTTLNTTLSSSNGQLPAALGPAAKANSLTTTLATDDPAALGIGGTADAAATPGSTGSLSAKLRAISGQLPLTSAGSVQITITRPANVTPYTAGDCVGAAAAALTFATGLTSGQRAMIVGADLMPQIAAVATGMSTFRLYLYNVTPPSALADNAAWDLSSVDRASFLGYLDLGTVVDLGSTCFVQNDNLPSKAIQLSGSANLFGYLVTNGGFTPANNSEVYLLRLQLIGL